jgi:hypothetical protein
MSKWVGMILVCAAILPAYGQTSSKFQPGTITAVTAHQNAPGESAILSFASDAENSPTEQAITVPMVGPPQHKVELSWKASNSKHVAGYNIYRGNRWRGPYEKINRSIDQSFSGSEHELHRPSRGGRLHILLRL